MLLTPVLILIAILSLSCGPAPHPFQNPNDPACESAACSGGGSSTASTSSPGSPSGSETGKSVVNEGAPTGSAYNFASSFSVTPQGCLNVDRVQIFENDSGLMVFLKANCGERSHVYGLRTSYSGTVEGSPILLSPDCNTGTIGVTGFTVDRSQTNYLLVYVCKDATYKTRILPVSKDLTLGSSVVLESQTTDSSYEIVWNESALAFGLVRKKQFQRLSETGVSIGGPINIADFLINQLVVDEGSWMIAHRILSGGYVTTYASSISSSGILGCNGANPGISHFGTNNYGAYGLFSGKNRFVHFAGVSNGDQADFVAAELDPTTCKKIGSESANAAISNTGKPYTVLGGILLNASTGSVLFSTAKSLILATYPRSGAFKLYAESSIAGFTLLHYSTARIIQGKIYVAYGKDGAGYISYSNESIP